MAHARGDRVSNTGTSGPSQPGSRNLRRWSLVAAPVIALVLCEVVARVAPPVSYAPPTVRLPDGTEVSTSALVLDELRTSVGEARSGPSSRLRPNLNVRGWYDRPRWDYFDADDCVAYRTNRFGFRDDDFPLVKPPGELRILALGDSMTFAPGVRAEDSWVAVLERGLAEAHRRPVQVINAGFASGHLPGEYLAWLVSDGLAFAPDVVLIGLTLNDMGDIPMAAHVAVELELGPSHALSHVRRLWEQWRLNRIVREHHWSFSTLVDADPETWEGTQRALLTMRDELAARHVRLVVAILPMISALDDDYPYRGLHDMARAFCRAEDIEAVDLMNAVINRHAPDLWVHPTDQHPNDVGHALLADGLLRYFDEHPEGGRRSTVPSPSAPRSR